MPTIIHQQNSISGVTFVLILLSTLCHLSLCRSFLHTSVNPTTQSVLSAGCSFQDDASLGVSSDRSSPLTYTLSLCFYRMSSVDVNDENRGVCPGGKQNSSINDIFALDQPTGRPSILRQTENLPSKTVPKAAKVQNQLAFF